MKKTSFANRIILVCVTVSLAVTVSVICEYHRLDTVMPPGVVTALLGLWGGELLIIALRQILGSDAVSKRRDTGQDDDASI